MYSTKETIGSLPLKKKVTLAFPTIIFLFSTSSHYYYIVYFNNSKVLLMKTVAFTSN